MNIVTYGEMLWDIYPDKKCIGGAPLNFSAHLSRHGENVSLMSAVGDDELGREILEQIDNWGINPQYISVLDNKETGKCLVTLDKNSVPMYNLLDDVAWDYIENENIFNEKTDVLYLGTLALRSESNYKFIKRLLSYAQIGEVFVDVNIRKPFYTDDKIRFLAENATILKISDEELSVICDALSVEENDYKKVAETLGREYKNLKLILITLGDKGAYLYDNVNKNDCDCCGEKVDVVSTVGAGDSFSAAFLHKYLRGEKLGECLKYAVHISAYVCSFYEAVPEYR